MASALKGLTLYFHPCKSATVFRAFLSMVNISKPILVLRNFSEAGPPLCICIISRQPNTHSQINLPRNQDMQNVECDLEENRK